MYIAMTETEKFKALVLIDYWQEQFPIAFPKKPAPKVPLKIGIGKEPDWLFYVSIAHKYTQEDIQNALYLWCRGKRYLQSFTTNTFRFSASGFPFSLVTDKDRVYVQYQLRQWKRKDGGGNNEKINYTD